MVSFIPPYDAVTTISLDTQNDVWPNQCSAWVTTTNTSPYIVSTTTTGSEDTPQINGSLSWVDLNPGDSIFFEQFGTTPTHGFLTVDSSGSFQYFPDIDYCGNDTFEFRAFDQLGHYADPVTQTLQIACVNDAPVALNDTGSGYAGNPILIDVLANDTDVDSIYQTQTFTINNHSTAANGTLAINMNKLDYTPNLWFSGTEVFSYRMGDQSGALSNTGTVSVNVTVFNTPPTATPASYSTNEDITLTGSLTGSDLESNPLTFSASTLPLHGTVTVLSNGSFTYVPTPNYFWADLFSFTTRDGMSTSTAATISLTVNPIPDAPLATSDMYSLDQDTILLIPVMMNDSDIDSPILTLTGYTNPAHGTLMISGTGFSYTPTTGYIGPDNFTYQVIDETNLTSNTAIVSLSVISTNAPPTANSGSFIVSEDAIYTGALIATDPENSTLSYVIDTFPSQGTLSLSATWVFVYMPNLNYFGFDSFTYHVSDGILISSWATINITVTSINDTPTANSLSLTATGNSAASSGNITSGIVTGSDVELSLLTFSASTLPLHGFLTLSSTWIFAYTPALGYLGADSFSFTVSDGSAMSLPATVSLNIVANGVVIVPVLHHFSITAPSTSYIWQPLTVSVQARDSSNNLIPWYTGSIVFSSATNTGAMMPSWGSPIAFTALDSGSKTFINAMTFTRTGSMTFVVRDFLTSISGSTTVIVLDTPPPSSNLTGWGGGWGWSQGGWVTYAIVNSWSQIPVTQIRPRNSNTNTGEEIPDLNSAPIESTVFVMDDPTGLLGQLFLTNKYILSQSSGQYLNINPNTSTMGIINIPLASQAMTIIDTLNSVTLDEAEWPIMLRYIARLFLQEIPREADPLSMYDYGILRVGSLATEPDSRLALTQEYVLRIFEQQKRKYEDAVYRNVSWRLEGSAE
jgi:VCBS repeat-containing protein